MFKRVVVMCLSFAVTFQPMRAQSPSRMPSVIDGPQASRWSGILRPYAAREVAPAAFDNSPRLHQLLRAGNLYLSLRDAISLAIENNLDIELERFALPLAATEVARAEGGGTLRGLLFTIGETPAGVGGPASPLITAPASQGFSGTSVATNASELAVLGEAQTNLSVLGTIPLSNGPAIPAYDPFLTAQYNWMHQTTPEVNSFVSGTGVLSGDVQNGTAGYRQGFSTGTDVNLVFTNSYQALNAIRNNYFPYTQSSLSLTVTQPLLRGFGREVNRRFIHIANIERKITNLLFRQQLIETVYGVVRLYTDLVALNEDVKVKEETLAFAQKLYEDTKAQVDEGTLAPVELTRARAQVSGSQHDLINARGLLEEQEAILKNVLTRRGGEDPQVQAARIVPTDPLRVPAAGETRLIADLLREAHRNRPDLAQAGLQVESSQVSLKGSRNALRPEVDLVGIATNNALAGDLNPASANIDPRFVGGYGSVLSQLATRKNPTYGIGIQLTLPLRNRVAQADALRDELQLRQTQVRARQLRNQVQLEVEDALIAMRRARAAYQAAVETRQLQEESLRMEQLKFSEGASTSFFVIQYQSYVAQAKSTEVAAESAYVKARAALQRAVGSILDDNHISFDAALNGRL
jgi:outer membrane protein TolC